MERDFYQLEYLSPELVEIVRGISKKSPPALHQRHMAYFDQLLRVQQIEAEVGDQSLLPQLVQKSLAAMRSNPIEDLHAVHEQQAAPIIARLAEGDMSILDTSEGMLAFMPFLAHQLLRTKKIRDDYFRDATGLSDLRPAWWFLSYMWGMSLGQSLYLGRHKATQALLINDTGTPFITSDQPVINIHFGLVEGQPPPEETDLYYPVSPRVAYALCDSHRFSGVIAADLALVQEMNQRVARGADRCIYGSTRSIICEMLPHVRQLG